MVGKKKSGRLFSTLVQFIKLNQNSEPKDLKNSLLALYHVCLHVPH